MTLYNMDPLKYFVKVSHGSIWTTFQSNFYMDWLINRQVTWTGRVCHVLPRSQKHVIFTIHPLIYSLVPYFMQHSHILPFYSFINHLYFFFSGLHVIRYCMPLCLLKFLAFGGNSSVLSFILLFLFIMHESKQTHWHTVLSQQLSQL